VQGLDGVAGFAGVGEVAVGTVTGFEHSLNPKMTQSPCYIQRMTKAVKKGSVRAWHLRIILTAARVGKKKQEYSRPLLRGKGKEKSRFLCRLLINP
jgi:hypothetical protein